MCPLISYNSVTRCVRCILVPQHLFSEMYGAGKGGHTGQRRAFCAVNAVSRFCLSTQLSHVVTYFLIRGSAGSVFFLPFLFFFLDYLVPSFPAFPCFSLLLGFFASPLFCLSLLFRFSTLPASLLSAFHCFLAYLLFCFSASLLFCIFAFPSFLCFSHLRKTVRNIIWINLKPTINKPQTNQENLRQLSTA